MSKVSDRVEEKLGFELDTSYVYYALLAAIFGFALWVRLLPRKSMEYLQALDPYMIARLSAAFAEKGYIPAIDAIRYFPFGVPVHVLNLGDIYIPAYLFEVARMFGMDFMEWAKAYPALMGALAVIPVFFIVREVFDSKAGILSSFFLASSVAIMHRSSAGWFEKEPIANLLMLTSLYFFIHAWRNEDWRSGIVSGLSLGIATVSWGGAKFLHLLYPLVVVIIVLGLPLIALIPSFIFEKSLKKLDSIRGLFVAFAPTVILGNFVAAAFNPSRWGLPNKFMLASFGILGLLAVRYAAERFEIVRETKLPYVGMGATGLGILGVSLSPIYSSQLYNMVQGFLSSALQSGGAVIAGTVAENTPASISQMVSKLGASFSFGVNRNLALFSEYFSGWTLSLIGASILFVYVVLMVAKAYFELEEIDYSRLIGLVPLTTALVSLGMFYGLSGSQIGAFIPALAITSLGAMFLYLGEYLASKEFEQWVGVSLIFWAALFILTAYLQAFVPMVGLVIAEGAFFIFYTLDKKKEVAVDWSYLVFLVWIASTLFGATQKSRLLFLTATPVSVVAGIALSKGIDGLRASSLWNLASKQSSFDWDWVSRGVVALVLVLTITINASAVYVMANGTDAGNRRVGGISGSPGDAWMENLEYMREETPKGSVVLSWWDYGYWFESIGERAAIADGGNLGFYSDAISTDSKINYPLADFLTSHSPENWTSWLSKFSVDYIALDSTMIGKYSAVSQIANRNNSKYNYMRTLNCKTQKNRCQIASINNQTAMLYEYGRGDIVVPVELSGNSASIVGTPIIRLGESQVLIENVCTNEGILKVTEDEGTSGGMQESISSAIRNDQPFGGCVSIHPARGAANIVLAPPEVMHSTLAKLYLMDGSEVGFAEKVFDNGKVKMWKVG